MREAVAVAMGGAAGCFTNLLRFLPNFFLVVPPEWGSVRAAIDLVDVMAERARHDPLVMVVVGAVV